MPSLTFLNCGPRSCAGARAAESSSAAKTSAGNFFMNSPSIARLPGHVDVRPQAVLSRPVGVLGHLELFFNLFERFPLARQVAHALLQERVEAFVLVEDLH